MIIPQTEFQHIANKAIRKRVLVLPVRYGRFGERQKPPTVGRVYLLRPTPSFRESQYPSWLKNAPDQPTRARAILWLIDQVLAPEPKPIEATIKAVDREGDTYLVHIIKGDARDAIKHDDPIFLARTAGYTTASSLAVDDAGEVLIDPKAGERARVVAQLQRTAPQVTAIRRLASQAETLRQAMTSMRAANQIRLAERNLAAAERILSEESLQSDSEAPELGQQGEAADLPRAPGVVSSEAVA